MIVYRMSQSKKKSEQGNSSTLTTSGKRKVSLVLEPDLGDRLERLALLRNQSLNKLCAELIVAGEARVHEEARVDAVGILEQRLEASHLELERTLKVEVGKMSGRLASLMARTALEAIASRALQLQVLDLQLDNQQDVKRLKELAWKSAVVSLKSPSPDLRESLDALVFGVSVSGTEALPRALGAVESLVSNLKGNLDKFERGVGKEVGAVQVDVKALREEVSWLSGEVQLALEGLGESLKPKGVIESLLKRR